MSKYKYDNLEHPDTLFSQPGRPSPIRDVFQQVEAFIRSQWAKGPSIPIGVLLEFLADKLNVFVARKALWQFRSTTTTRTFVESQRIVSESLWTAVSYGGSSRHPCQPLSEASTTPSSSTWTKWALNGTPMKARSCLRAKRDGTQRGNADWRPSLFTEMHADGVHCA